MRTFLAAPLLLALTLAPNYTPVDVWEADWQTRIETQNLTVPMLTEWQRIHDLYPWWTPAPPEPVYASILYPPDVERWRTLVEKYFQPADVAWAMRVMDCESNGVPNAKNPTSTASGLLQHLATYWPERSAAAGWGGASIFDPEANIAVGAWLYYTGGASHWVCR